MASKKKAANSAAEVGMAEIVRLTKANEVAYTAPDEHKPLIEQGLVEVNTAMVADGKTATRATAKGIASVEGAGFSGTQSSDSEPAAKSSFEIEDGIAIPAITGRGRIASLYPFDGLQVGQSFFVEKPAKNLASTVSSANARYSEEVAGQTRKDRKGNTVPLTKLTRQFIVRSAEKDGKSGSRVFRKA